MGSVVNSAGAGFLSIREFDNFYVRSNAALSFLILCEDKYGIVQLKCHTSQREQPRLVIFVYSALLIELFGDDIIKSTGTQAAKQILACITILT